MTEQPNLITSVLLSADLTKNLFIAFDGSLCGNGAKALGVLNADTDTNDYGPVVANGIALVYSGAAVAQGTKIQSNAAGKAITFASGADELIRVLLT
jgi:hypothetical protein